MLLFHFAVRAGIMFVLLTIGLTGAIVALVKTFDSLADPSRSAPPPLVLAPHCFMNPKLVEERTSLQSAQGAYNAIQAECSAMNATMIAACPIPNVVHLVWLPGGSLSFRHYLSLKSIHDRLRPDAIYMHGYDFPTADPIFQKFVSEFHVTPVLARNVTHVHERPVTVVEHKSDVIRLEALTRFGGMYFDLDVFVLKPLTVFMREETVMPRENHDGLNNGLILAKRCSRFLRRWYEEYSTFDDNNWALHSVRTPKRLFDEDATGITVNHEELKSNWPHTANMFFSDNASPSYWRPVLAIHSLVRAQPQFANLNESQVVALDNNYGRIARRILVGTQGFM